MTNSPGSEYNALIPKLIECAGGVVENEHGCVLVVAKKNGKTELFSWSIPKGAVRNGEELEEAARREIEEESGVTRLKFVRLLGTYERNAYSNPKERKCITVFHFRTSERSFEPQDPQHPVSVWVQPSQVAALLSHPKDKEFFKQMLKKLRS